jgi:type VI secretion system ImpA family protein
MIFEKNLNDFLNDISVQSPVGEDLKYKPVYDKIQESLREDLDLPQGVWVQDLKVADWKGAETLCCDTLQKESKDLQITSWLVEIWMSLYQMPGLKNGLELVLKLSEKYWDAIYPLPQNGDMEFRMAPFLWLNEKLSKRIHRIIITAPVNATAGSQTFAQYLAVRDYLYQKTQPPAEMGQNINDFQTSIAKTPSEFLVQLNKDTQAVISTTQQLESFLDSKFGKAGPTLYHMREVLGEFSQYCQQTLIGRGESLTEKKEEKMDQNPSSPNPLPESINDPIKNRDDAYRIIQEVADYLYKIEPHSPTPFLIRKAISWGHLSFEELMNEVVQDQGSVSDMRRLLGLDSAQQSSPQSVVDNKKTGQQAPWTVEQSN